MSRLALDLLEREPSRREAILTATLELIAEGGVDSITHRRVAKHADIPLGSTTYYFESREHLIRAAFDLYLEYHRALRAEIDIDPTKDLKAALDYLIAFTSLELEHRDLLITEYEMTLFAARDPLLADKLNEWYDSMTDQIAGSLKGVVSREPREVARAVLQLLRGNQLERLTSIAEDEKKLRKRLHTLISAYV